MKESTTYQTILRERGLQVWLEAWKEGWKEGWEEGWKLGQLKGWRESVLIVLDERFGVIPPAVEEQIRSKTDMEELRQLLRAAVTVARPEDLPL